MRRLSKRFLALLYCTAFIAVVTVCHFGSSTVTTMVENAPVKNKTVIIIDAGHGGIDGGATSCTGVLESKTNLDIALILNDLMHLLGFDTRMTRTTDTSIYTEGNTIASQKVSDLKNRVALVNGTDNALLISIHQNTFTDQRYDGAQVFTCDDSESNTLARAMQSALISNLNPHSHRKVKSSKGIYLMEHINKPGILIECGFISNPEEAVKLNDPIYQKKLCCVMAAVISQYKANT